MSLTSDIYLRLYLLNYQNAKNKEFRTMYSTISHGRLAKHKGAKGPPISINIDDDLEIA